MFLHQMSAPQSADQQWLGELLPDSHSTEGYPTTYVVDRSGNIVGEPIVGAITGKAQAETLQRLIDQTLAADMG